MQRKDLMLMDELMAGITSSKEWCDIQINNPEITRGSAHLSNIMEKVKNLLPRNLYLELSEAQTDATASYIDPAIMYGIHVAFVLMSTAAQPEALSQYVLERMKGALEK